MAPSAIYTATFRLHLLQPALDTLCVPISREPRNLRWGVPALYPVAVALRLVVAVLRVRVLMGKRRATLAGRAWKLLRLALLWATKAGVLRRELLPDLRLVPSYIKSLRAVRSDGIRFSEREFSFDETPLFQFHIRRPRSMRMPHIPCINPPVDFDSEDDVVLFGRDGGMNFLRRGEAEEEDGREGGDLVASGGDEWALEEDDREEDGKEPDRGVDVKAEEFIARFYQQMKLQRQISLLQYNEMLLRSTGH